MEILPVLISLPAGLILLWKCADLLVSGAVGLAHRFGISSTVIGLTVVAMGTSAPEAAASIAAVLKDSGGGDIALGNICGSNIANLALVGGVIAIINPLKIAKQTLIRDIPIMLVVTLLLWPILRDGSIVTFEAVLLLIVFVIVTLGTIRSHKRRPCALEDPPPDNPSQGSVVNHLVSMTGGLIGLAVGAKLAVYGAVILGQQLGMSNTVIGLTIIAIGTSLPELVTCIVAALRGHHGISVGNLVGSNIFNTLLVTGLAGSIRPFDISSRLAGGPDYWIMVGVSLGFYGLALLGRGVIRRSMGYVLSIVYMVYMAYLLGYS
jgi:cation:H+ antiporter